MKIVEEILEAKVKITLAMPETRGESRERKWPESKTRIVSVEINGTKHDEWYGDPEDEWSPARWVVAEIEPRARFGGAWVALVLEVSRNI